MPDQRKDFFDLSSNELLAFSLILTLLLADGLNANQLNILGNFFCTIGQNFLTLQSAADVLPATSSLKLKPSD